MEDSENMEDERRNPDRDCATRGAVRGEGARGQGWGAAEGSPIGISGKGPRRSGVAQCGSFFSIFIGA